MLIMGKRIHHTPEQIIEKLREADALKAEGLDNAEVARRLNVSAATLYAWRKKYEGMSRHDAKELKALRDENARLKKLLANAELEKDALKFIAEGKF